MNDGNFLELGGIDFAQPVGFTIYIGDNAWGTSEPMKIKTLLTDNCSTPILMLTPDQFSKIEDAIKDEPAWRIGETLLSFSK